MGGGGGGYGYFGEKSLPSNITHKKNPLFNNTTTSLSLEGTQLCVPLLYGHIFLHKPSSMPIQIYLISRSKIHFLTF